MNKLKASNSKHSGIKKGVKNWPESCKCEIYIIFLHEIKFMHISYLSNAFSFFLVFYFLFPLFSSQNSNIKLMKLETIRLSIAVQHKPNRYLTMTKKTPPAIRIRTEEKRQ